MGREGRFSRVVMAPHNTSQSVSVGHVHVIGRTRSGKSKGIVGWILQAIGGSVGICVIDPHGDLFDDSVSYLALMYAKKPHLSVPVVIINPLDPYWSVGFNPLQLWPGEVPERKALFLADIITKIFQDDPTIVVRMRRVMRNAFQALMELNLTLVELPRFLVDRGFRESLLRHVSNPQVRTYWHAEFPENERDADAWVGSTLNRMEPLVNDPDFRLIFGQHRSTINLREIMDEGYLLFVRTSKGELMDDNSRLLGAFIVAQIQQAAMTRAELPDSQRRLFWLVLDEFQNYVSPAISTLLEETGKYKLVVLLAHQHLAQLRDKELRAAVLSQCSDIVCFGSGEEDAKFLAPKIFRPDIDQAKHVQIKPANWGKEVVLPYEDITWRPQSEIWAIEERKLFGLKPRYFWHKRRGYQPGLYKSFYIPNVRIPDELVRWFVDQSVNRYAIQKQKARQIVEEERANYLNNLISSPITIDDRFSPEKFDKPSSIWG